MTKSQIFFWLLIAFIAGVAAASFLPLGLPILWAVFVFGGAVAVFGIRQAAEREGIIVSGACLIVAAFGMFWFIRAASADLPLENALGKAITVEGVVVTEPRESARSQQLIVQDEATGARALVFARKFPAYRYGDRVRAKGEVRHPENFAEDFDYAAYLAKDDIYYVMSFPELSMLKHGGGRRAYAFLFSVKAQFSRTIERILPEPHAAFLKGLLIGERQSFSEELREELRRTGTTHLVALSGYNITIVGDNLLRLLRFFLMPFAAAFWVATAGIVGFVLLTGAQASVVRAAIMGLLVLVARREGRQYRMQNALAFAAFVMLLENPKILRFDVAFQLSFLATLGLVYGSPLFERWYDRARGRVLILLRDAGVLREHRGEREHRRRRSIVRETLTTTFGAQLFVAPLLVFSFGSISLVSPVANLFVLPMIPYTMFAGFVAALSGLAATAAGGAVGWIAWLLLEYELRIIGAFAAIPHAAIENRAVGFIVVLFLYSALAFWLWQRWRKARSTVRV